MFLQIKSGKSKQSLAVVVCLKPLQNKWHSRCLKRIWVSQTNQQRKFKKLSEREKLAMYLKLLGEGAFGL